MGERDAFGFDLLRRSVSESGRSLAQAARAQRLAFSRHQEAPLGEAEKSRKHAETTLLRERENLAGSYRDSSDADTVQKARCLAEAAYSFESIGAALQQLSQSLRKKIQERVLFSDRAVKAVSEIFHRTQRQVRDVSDTLATCNPTLRAHVLHWCDNLSNLMSQATNDHEERLVQGLCTPPASQIFVSMMDSLRAICHHVRDIASLCPAEEDEA